MSVIETLTRLQQNTAQTAASCRESADAMARTETRLRDVIAAIEQPRAAEQLKTLAELVLSGATMLRENAERNVVAFSEMAQCLADQRELLQRFKDQTN